jgi:hypothetical protein
VAIEKIHETEIDKRVGYQKEPIITCIDFDYCVIDLLHLHLRITDQLFNLLVAALNENDPGTGLNLEDRPNFKKFLEFLQNNCRITKPFYVNQSENTIKLRNLNGIERNRVFEKMYKQQNMIDLFPNLENRLLNLNFLFAEYFSLLNVIKSFCSMPIDLGALETRLRKWLEFYIIEHPKITPYIHCFVFHMTDFLLLNPDLNLFNIQGLEKLNDLTKQFYFSQTNKKNLACIKQLVEKRNRYEFLESNGLEDDLFE